MQEPRTIIVQFVNWHIAEGDSEQHNTSECVKSVHIWSYSVRYFAAFRLNREIYFVVFSPIAGKYAPE